MFLTPIRKSFALMDKTQKVELAGLTAARVGLNALEVAALAGVGLLATVIGNSSDRTNAEFLGFQFPISSEEGLVVLVVAVVGLFVTKSLIGAVLLRATSLKLADIESKFAENVARYIFGGDLSRLSKFSRGDIQWATTRSSYVAVSSLLGAGMSLVSETALFLSVFVFFLIVNPLAALFVAGFFGMLLGAFQLIVNSRLRMLGLVLSEKAVEMANASLDMVSSFRELFVHGTREPFIVRFSRSRRDYARQLARERFLQGLPRFFAEGALMIGFASLFLWQYIFSDGEDGLVTLGVFLAGGLRMMAAVLPIQNSYASIKSSSPQAERAQTLLREAAETETIESPIAPRSASKGAPPVTIRNLSFRYGNDKSFVLKGVSLEIEPGEFLAIVGSSGSGKSTLVELILGLYEPSEGSITIGGISPNTYSALGSGGMAYVPQQPGLITGTVGENIALFSNASEIDAPRFWRAVRAAHLEEFVKSLAKREEEELGPLLDSMSGGQAQRIGIARAVYQEARLVVLDEATSALDSVSEKHISDSIGNLAPQATVIVVAHRLSTIQNADKIVLLDEGQVVDVGTFPELVKGSQRMRSFVSNLGLSERG